MKKILFVAAVEEELAAARLAYSQIEREKENLSVDFMLTGIGATSTTYKLTKVLAGTTESYDLVIDLGIAGAFTDEIKNGDVVQVVKSLFGDMGVEGRLGFQTLFEYSLLDANTKPYTDGCLLSGAVSQEINAALSSYPKVTSLTVQTVTGDMERNYNMKKRFNPDIESMESAAFFYVMILENIPFIELRAISNRVGERDTSKWTIALALENLQKAVLNVLNAI